jgi:hypothetical protein
MICERLEINMSRYEQTVATLFSTDPAFAELYRRGQGFCLSHLSDLLSEAKGELTGKNWDSFFADTLAMEKASLARITDDLKQFTVMFDYRNAGKDWGTSRDALPRAIAKLRGQPNVDE